MKSSRKYVTGAVALIACILGRAELAPWVQHLVGGSPLEAVFFRDVALPSGVVKSRKPPRETVAELTKQIAAAPSRADLVALRAHEAELNLDFATAEQDWKTYARIAADKIESAVALADFYHRRVQPKEELAALLTAAALPATARDALNSETAQQSWKLFERSLALADAQLLPAESIYEAWISRYPAQSSPYRQYFEYLVARGQTQRAQQQIDRYAKAFPRDDAFPLQARALLLPAEEALRLYDRAFRPVQSPSVIGAYFELLNRTRNTRKFLADARAAAAANPNDLNAAARLFYYYQQQGNLPQAHRALIEFRMRRTNPTPDELLALATLFEETNNLGEAARCYQLLSRVQGPQAENGLAGLIAILFRAPEQPLPVGQGDISFYRDIATMDPYPGTLNGILSLLFNSTDPQWRYSEQERAAESYFHHVTAAELLKQLETRFPQSPRLAELHAMLLNAYAQRGETDEVIKRGQEFLSANPASPSRTTVWLLIADAHARRNRLPQEFAVYDSLLRELAANAKNVPLGTAGEEIPAPLPENGGYMPRPQPRPVRSSQYAEVLDRYLNRLVSLKRVKDALALYRREIDRNPSDPGLYERFAEFLNQNRMASEIEQVYSRATQQFQDRSWHHKLARWYLRQKQTAAFGKLTQSIAATFAGSELDSYFQQVVANAGLDAVLYRQVNLYAHQRFPHDLVFVKNLLNAYQAKGTSDPNAFLALLRQNWYHDSELRSRFFQHLSSTGRLEAEIAALRSAPAPVLADRAAVEMIAGAEIWRSHFENAAPAMQSIAANYPAHEELNSAASSLYRSLGQIETAAQIADRLARSRPGDFAALTRVGEIHADREEFEKSRAYWNRVAAIEPGRADGYLHAATVYWDYFLYDDALRVIADGRTKLNNPAALAYEAGAIYENKRDYQRAIAEYLKGAEADPDSPSRRRLVRLASRPGLRDTIEAQTRSLAEGSNPSVSGWNLRVALLEEQNRRDDIATLLTATTNAVSNFELLARVDQVAERNGLAAAREHALSRQAALTPDPVERTRLRLLLARLAEDRNDKAAAQRSIETAYKDNPNIAGVVRSAVDYYWRTGDRKRAVDTLADAAGRSNPSFKRQFTLEAARKATDLADYARARTLLNPVLAAEPLASDIVAAAAETYARAGDDKGLRSFYSERLKLAKTADQRSALRRGLIPVLTRTKDYPAAIGEYIAILNAYPEDEALVAEAARYARKYGLQDRLTAFYVKAAADSPKDPRWPMLLARVQTSFENLPAAIESYTRALAIRPDRSDLLASRASLEERLMRFDEAAKSYAKLYDLAYKDPQFMVKAAENRARLGQKAEAIDALRTAFIEGKAAKAESYLEIASKLEQWNWLAEARQYAAEGRKLDAEQGVALQARISTRLRDYIGVDSEQGLQAAAQAVREFYTPEEKAAFGAWLMRLPFEDKARIALSAGLYDVAVRDLHARITADPKRALDTEGQQLIQIEQQRLMYAELAGYLEGYARALGQGDPQIQLFTQAAEQWRLAVNPREELRVRQVLFQRGTVPDPDRYAQLLFTVAPERFVQAAAGSNQALRDASIALAYRSGDAATALRIVNLRGAKKPPVWTRAYTSLTGVYFNHREPAITAAFDAVLGPRTVGEQIAARADRDQQVVGDVWFYYGARYGEFTNSEEYLASEMEGRPASANSYVALGDYYRARKEDSKALEEYGRALQLDPSAAAVHNVIAEIYAAQKKSDQALRHWREAIRLWTEAQDGRVSEDFWTGVASTIEHAGPGLRPEIDRLLRTYIRRNGTYRIEPLLSAIWKASSTPAAAAEWAGDLSTAAAEPSQFLAAIVNEEFIGPTEREVLFSRILDLAQREADRRAGDARNDARWRLMDYQIRYLRTLTETRQYAKAEQFIRGLSQESRESMRASLIPIEIEAAAATGRLDTILQRDDIDSEQFKQAAASLRRSGDLASARRLLEVLYTRELDSGNRDASVFLGLAEVKLEQNDTQAAVALLRRMTLVTDDPLETLRPAAELLDRFNRTAEAAAFWEMRKKAAPWDQRPRSEPVITSQDIGVLREAIARDPMPLAPRVQLFNAYFKAEQFEPALSVFRGQPPQEAAIVRDHATAYRKTGNLEQARQFLRMLKNIDPSQNIAAELAGIDAELKRIQENQQRAPHVHDNLDQTQRVRARV